MDSTSAIDIIGSTSANDLKQKSSAYDKHITTINFRNVFDFSEPTSKGSFTPEPGSTAVTSKKVASPQAHGAGQIRAALDSHVDVTKSGLKEIETVSAVTDGVSVPDRSESPWGRFRLDYELDLGGFISIVSDRLLPHDIFMIKRLDGPHAARKARILRKIDHENFHAMLECFIFEGSCYPVFQHVPVSLAHIAKSPPYPTEFELAAALGQVYLLNDMWTY